MTVIPIRGLKLRGIEEKLFVTVSLRISNVDANSPLRAPRRQNRLGWSHACREERRGVRERGKERGEGDGERKGEG
jgi:hypothetical protein